MVSIISGKRQLEYGVCSLAVYPPKYKRRKVSAVRQFPAGCSANIAQSNMQNKEVEYGRQKVFEPSKDLDSSGEQGGGLFYLKGKKILGKIDESNSFDVPFCSSSYEKVTSSLVKSKITGHAREELQKLFVDQRSNGILKEPIIEEPKLSKDLRKWEDESMMKHETHDTLKELMEVRVESAIALNNTIVAGVKKASNDIQSEDVAEGTTMQLYLLPHYPIPFNFVWKERKYLPCGTVSAARDFPPRCGPNVQVEPEDKHLGKEDGNSFKEVASVNQVGDNFEADDFARDKIRERVCALAGDGLEGQREPDRGVDTEVITKMSQFGKSMEIKGHEEICRVKDGEQHERLLKKEEYNGKDEDGVKREIIVHVKDKHKKKKSGGVSSSHVELIEKTIAGVQNVKNMVVVQGLMAAPNCPWRQGKGTVKPSPSTSIVKQSKRKRHDHGRQEKFKRLTDESTVSAIKSKERIKMIMPYLRDTEIKEVSGCSDEGDNSEYEELSNDVLFVPEGPTPSTLLLRGAGSSSKKNVRSNVREVLRLFRAVVRKLLQEEETKTKSDTKSKDQENAKKRIDIRAVQKLKDLGYVNTGKKCMLGPIPGVEVGDFFHYRVELSISGLHRLPQAGIDYIKQGNRIIATSIVDSGVYANDVDSSDVLIYTGQGGNAKCGDKEPEDQKLERGNLALRNSIDEKNVVRVIRGCKENKPSETGDGKPKTVTIYTYDGLYAVEKYWQDLGPRGKLVYKFELRRLPGQPELAWKEVKRSKKFKVQEGRSDDDISGGKETFPICAVNAIDDEKPPAFTYITRMMYPDWCWPILARGCDCGDGCSDLKHCTCAVKNGGEIPYNYNGEIFVAKPLVYECGPSCGCPPTCYNRVSQCGIKFPLEIFKTESRGWGVRSLSSIPSGSFICEYIGELLDDKQAEQRAGDDEYLFDIGQNYNDTSLWEGLSALMPDMASSSSDVVENVGFTIDAAKFGNIGRFINHSCSPNLYAQNVLYDHDDRRIPHIMLFAIENIPPLQELTYHYNYVLDQVFDSNGNIKKKSCYCGSSECTGRMY